MRTTMILISVSAAMAAPCRYQFGKMCFTDEAGSAAVVSVATPAVPAPPARPTSGAGSVASARTRTLSQEDFRRAAARLHGTPRSLGGTSMVVMEAAGGVSGLAARMQVEEPQLRMQTVPRFRVGESVLTGDDAVVVKPSRQLNNREWAEILALGADHTSGNVADILRRNNGIYRLRSTRGEHAFDLATRLAGHRLIKFAEPDYVIGVRPQSASSAERLFTEGRGVRTNDPLLRNQWALRNAGPWQEARGGISLGGLWRLPSLADPPVVAIVDDGVQPDHPDLQPQLLEGFDATDRGGTEGEEEYGWNDHGTRVAGIVGAVADNGFGIAGVAPFARILPVRAFYREQGAKDHTFRAAELAAALSWAAERAAVINISWQYPIIGNIQEITEVLQQMPQRRGGRGVVVVASSGNTGSAVTFPASLSREIPGLIAVGAADRSDTVKQCDGSAASCDGENDWGSGHGPELDVVAPGVDVLSTRPCQNRSEDDCFARFDGTSAAAPFVSALAAHLLARQPDLTAAEVKAIIRATADPLEWAVPDARSGYGRINVCAALGGVGCHGWDLVGGERIASVPRPSSGRSRQAAQ